MNQSSKPLVVLATGGTGGHVFPAEALAIELVSKDCRLALFTDKRGGTFSGVLGGLDSYRIRAGGIAGKSLLALIQSGPELAIGLFQARSLLRKMRPSVLVGFGGYASIPTMLAACLSDYPTVIHEQNAVLGRANRLLASRVDAIATCFEVVEGLPKLSRRKVAKTGMPVRPTIIEYQNSLYPEFTCDGEFRVLVIGGSQGARIMSDVVPAAITALPEKIRRRISVVQQCRAEDLERVRTVYNGSHINCKLANFFDDIPKRMTEAHLVITRAGASTIAELTAIGRPSILVPYAYAVDDHQARNAHAINDAGAGWVLPETAFSPNTLGSRIESLFRLPLVLERTASSARALGRPSAAKDLANLVLELIPNGANQGRCAA